MADSVTSTVHLNDGYFYIASFTNVSDGTGESAVLKIDKSTLTAAKSGIEPLALDIEYIWFSVDNMRVTLLWDHASDSTAIALCGTGEYKADCLVPLRDPKLSDSTGDLLITTAGAATGDQYFVLVKCRLRT